MTRSTSRSRLAGPRGRRLGLCAPIAAAALLLGGPLGVAVAIMMVLVALDAALPMPGRTRSDADERLRRAVRARRLARARARLARRPPAALTVLDDRSGWAATAERRPLGIQAIGTDSVSGTVEAVKARTFDADFRPDRGAAERWKRLWLAQASGSALPPISVYRVDGAHIVRDGHHRLSVARDHGLPLIDADVVELTGPGACVPARPCHGTPAQGRRRRGGRPRRRHAPR